MRDEENEMDTTQPTINGVPASMTELADRELVTMAMGGDKGALSTLLQRYKPVVMRHLQRYPVDDADRKDLLQEAMLQVVRKLHTFRGDAQFST